jgi:vacuolar-type H+-ATPase subunit F/Vma7
LSNYKLIIITNSELATGFRLAGVAVEEARNGAEAEAIISRMLRVGREFGIVGIDEDLNAELSPKILEELDEAGIPLLIPFPTAGIFGLAKMKREEEDYTANLIRNAIGYHIKLKRG